MNKIKDTILDKGGDILNVYFTAGFPNLEDTAPIVAALTKSGVDLIELGMPYSDPLADGTTIQQSSEKALRNGLNLRILFDQIVAAREVSEVPIIMMGYYNQLLQYGVEKFLAKAASCGVNGMIIPDLPMNIYQRDYEHLFKQYGLSISFLITPQTAEKRIQQANELSSAFIYMVSQSSITGKSGAISKEQLAYFERIDAMKLSTPRLIGFGIHNQKTYQTACQYSHGAIVGSAYIRALAGGEDIATTTEDFIKTLR